MKITLKKLANKAVGSYSPVGELTGAEMVDLKAGGYPDVYAALEDMGIVPCQTCGAYRRRDECKVCEEVEKNEG
jgi:hypothetical protein